MSASHDSDRPHREDVLLHRALERVATEAEWTEIDALGAADAALYRRLAAQLRDEGRLATARAAIDRVARIELDDSAARLHEMPPRRFALSRPLAGWTAAAASLLLWAASALRATAPPPAPERSPLAADDRSLGELSNVLVDARRDGDEYELLYLRRSFERVRVPVVLGTAYDEHGNAAMVPASLTAGSREF
jgi:hypothetical protein